MTAPASQQPQRLWIEQCPNCFGHHIKSHYECMSCCCEYECRKVTDNNEIRPHTTAPDVIPMTKESLQAFKDEIAHTATLAVKAALKFHKQYPRKSLYTNGFIIDELEESLRQQEHSSTGDDDQYNPCEKIERECEKLVQQNAVLNMQVKEAVCITLDALEKTIMSLGWKRGGNAIPSNYVYNWIDDLRQNTTTGLAKEPIYLISESDLKTAMLAINNLFAMGGNNKARQHELSTALYILQTTIHCGSTDCQQEHQ
jgi:hypothetical protein